MVAVKVSNKKDGTDLPKGRFQHKPSYPIVRNTKAK